MGDYAIRARFEAQCAPSEVIAWLATAEGVAGWWSDKVEGDPGTVGRDFHVTFPTSPVVFDLVVSAASDNVVEWHVPASPPWWRGTRIRFELESADDRTRMLFVHGGFEPDDPIIEIITPAWVRFLDNLVAVAESGTPNPAVIN